MRSRQSSPDGLPPARNGLQARLCSTPDKKIPQHREVARKRNVKKCSLFFDDGANRWLANRCNKPQARRQAASEEALSDPDGFVHTVPFDLKLVLHFTHKLENAAVFGSSPFAPCRRSASPRGSLVNPGARSSA